MSLWASVLVSGGHDEKDFYRLVTNKYSGLSRSVSLILSWLLISLGCTHVAIINCHIQPRSILVVSKTILLQNNFAPSSWRAANSMESSDNDISVDQLAYFRK